ncbi:MAG: sulfite exporter TauE/SafE family protein [Planctomycetes bacterium]|nr:sulfite exporter TauE/SafE family protein [Planctomycetota bacterium]
MLEFPFVFLGGLLGSAHCLGMCGPLALVVGTAQPGWRGNLVRQLVFSTGRIFTYTTLGASAAYAGLSIAHRTSSLVHVQAWLAIASGFVLVVMGLATAGVLPRRVVGGGGITCLAGTWLSTLLRDPRLSHAFLAGIFTGFIPCGLVYAFLALAASSGQMFLGALTMAVFGAGTIPLMILAGLGGTLLGYQLRSRVLQTAAWCVVITGLIAIARGTGFLGIPGVLSGSGCPFCS